MVFERIFVFKTLYYKPYFSFFIGLIAAILSVFFSYFIFVQYAGVIMIVFLILFTIPYIYSLLFFEEKFELNKKKESDLMKRHLYASFIYLLLFLGFTSGYCFSYIFLLNFYQSSVIKTPNNSLSIQMFNPQLKTLSKINGRFNTIIGDFHSKNHNFVNQFSVFLNIFENNLVVVLVSFVLSFILGSGAIFILGWNSSVLGIAIANNMLGLNSTHLLTGVGSKKLISHTFISPFISILRSLVRYLPHGIPEIYSYIVAGVAGGMISVAVVKHDFRSKKFEKIMYDVSDLFLISILFLVFAAFIEVYITPVLYLPFK